MSDILLKNQSFLSSRFRDIKPEIICSSIIDKWENLNLSWKFQVQEKSGARERLIHFFERGAILIWRYFETLFYELQNEKISESLKKLKIRENGDWDR